MECVPKILAAFNSLKVSFPTALYVIGNAALFGILFGLETLLEKSTPCPCNPELNMRHVVFVFLVPVFVLPMVSLVALPDSRKLLKCWCIQPQETDSPKTGSTKGQSLKAKARGCCTRKLCHFTVIPLLKAFMPSLMWIIILLLDGDYIACAKQTPGDKQSCEEICSYNPTPHLSRVCIISREWGGGLLVVSAFILMMFRVLPTYKCSNWTWKGYYEAKYKRKLEKAKEIKMKENIAEVADEEAGIWWLVDGERVFTGDTSLPSNAQSGDSPQDVYYKDRYKRELDKATVIKMKAKIEKCANDEAVNLVNKLKLSGQGSPPEHGQGSPPEHGQGSPPEHGAGPEPESGKSTSNIELKGSIEANLVITTTKPKI